MKDRLSILTRDSSLAQALADPLVQAGFEVQVLSTAPKYWQRARRFMSSLLLVDLDTMGDENLSQCRRLRVLTSASIVVLSRPQEEDHVVKAFRTGIDEYMTKPISEAEMVVRVQSLLRRRRGSGRFRISRMPICPDVTLDTEGRTLHVRGRRVKLTPIEYSLLDCLAHHAGQVVPRSTLLRHAWGEAGGPSAGSLNLYIYYLRRKIERDPRHPKHILTKWGIGYQLVKGESQGPQPADEPNLGA